MMSRRSAGCHRRVAAVVAGYTSHLERALVYVFEMLPALGLSLTSHRHLKSQEPGVSSAKPSGRLLRLNGLVDEAGEPAGESVISGPT